MASARTGGRRALAANLALSAGSAILVFGGAELVLRLTGLAPTRALRSADARTLERIPGLYQPGQEFVDRVRADLPARVRINNLGFRGRDRSEAKPAGVYRVLALGDSYTFGDHVDDDEAWPARLEADLRAIRPALDVEVINGGANGFGLLDERALWRRSAPRLGPDAVVVGVSPNDVSDMTRPEPLIDQMRAHAGLKSAPIVGPSIRFLQDTAVFNALQMAAARLRVATRSGAALPAVEPARAGPESAPAAWEAYRDALGGFAGDLRGSGARALLVLLPSHGQVTGEERAWTSEVLPGWAAAAGWPCLDLLPAFRAAAARGEVLYLVPRDSHPAPRGHALAAAQIMSELDRLGWIPPTGGPER